MSDEATPTRVEWVTGAPGDWIRCQDRVTYPSRAQAIELAVSLSRAIPGNIVEFGSYRGWSTRVIRDELWRAKLWDRRQWGKRIYACDSFQGLPEAYEHLPAGTFATTVPRLRGVRIVEGFFGQSLTPTLAAEVGQVSLAHIDADLYSSTVTVLEWLRPLLVPGSLLLFDEFLGEDPAEARAFAEWADRYDVHTELVALFGREPSGKGAMTDRRALVQVVGAGPVRRVPPLFPVRVRRRIAATW